MTQSSVQTAERLFPQQHWKKRDQYLLFLRQLFAYQYVEQFVSGKRVLDLGCGSGFGLTALAKQTRMSVGVDKDFTGLAFARTQGAKEPSLLFFLNADVHHLPFPEQSFDVVLSFQVIEHVRRPTHYLQAIRKVLVPGGLAIFTTPNRRLRLLPFQKPWNRYHLREYNEKQLYRLLQSVFAQVQLLGITATSDIVALEKLRVKPDPWLVYGEFCYNVLAGRLPARVIFPLEKILQHRRKKKAERLARIQYPSVLSRQYSLHDYSISKDDLRGCLDLLACCWTANFSAR